MRLLIVPRWGGAASSDFYPWLLRELTRLQLFSSIEFCVLESPPELESAASKVRAALQQSDAPTVLMGHSVGFQAAMRAAVSVPVVGLFGVAAWWSVDAPWPSILPWIETPFDWAKLPQQTKKRFVLLSDNDPFTADAFETARLFQERVQAQTKIIAGGKHFNQGEEPAVLASLVSFTKEITSGLDK
jgi:predicted alpha/beta hydrolase family esterase